MKLIGRMEEVDCSGDFKPVAEWVRDTPPPPPVCVCRPRLCRSIGIRECVLSVDTVDSLETLFQWSADALLILQRCPEEQLLPPYSSIAL